MAFEIVCGWVAIVCALIIFIISISWVILQKKEKNMHEQVVIQKAIKPEENLKNKTREHEIMQYVREKIESEKELKNVNVLEEKKQNKEKENMFKGKLIKGDWVRKGTVNLDSFAKPGLCKCWVERDVLETILQKAEYIFDEIKNDLEECEGLYCVYVGYTSNMAQRLKKNHVCGSLSSSALRRNLNKILKDSYLLDEIINKIYFECVETESGKDEKGDSLTAHFYLLN